MRTASDKEFELRDLEDLFEQCVETDLLQQFSDDTVDPSSSDDLARLFDELPSSNGSDPIETSPIPNWDATEVAWHKALERLEQNLASPDLPSNSFSIYPHSRGKAAQSDSELFSIDDLFELDLPTARLSLSSPSTPTPQHSESTKKGIPSLGHTIRNGIQKSTKSSNILSKMMRPSNYRSGFQDILTHKTESPADPFNFTLPPGALPHHPLPPSKLLQNESDNFEPYNLSMSPLPDASHTPKGEYPNYQLTPLSSPTIDKDSCNSDGSTFQFSGDNMATAYISANLNNAAPSALQTPPPTHRLSMTPWDEPGTPINLEYGFLASSAFPSPNTGRDQAWWGSGVSEAALAQPRHSTPYLANPRPQNQNRNGHVGYSTVSTPGLGINCDSTDFGGFGMEMNGSTNDFHSAPASSIELGFNNIYTNTNAAPTHGLSAPSTTANDPTSPSRSPSLSPQPHFTRRRSRPSHSHPSSHSRRKSSNSSTNSHQRHSSTGSGPVGFVNFTPDDSRKILTGVAPSGSSKTKARREKEAAEKRRKLSQAAVKAVIEAGGDVGRLEREGFFYEEV